MLTVILPDTSFLSAARTKPGDIVEDRYGNLFLRIRNNSSVRVQSNDDGCREKYPVVWLKGSYTFLTVDGLNAEAQVKVVGTLKLQDDG